MKAHFAAALIVAGLAFPALASQHEADVAAHKATAARILLEKMGKGDFSRLDEIYGPGFVAHSGTRSYTLDEDNASGKRLREMFPGMQVTVERIVGEGDLVALHWRATGSYRDPAAATGSPARPVNVQGMSFFRLADGRVVEEWSITDELGLQRQLAAQP